MDAITFDSIPSGLAENPEHVELFELIKKDLEAVVAYYKTLATDGISLSDIWNLTSKAVASFVAIADKVYYSNDSKKAVVLAAAEKFFDTVIAPLDIPYVPGIIESRIVDPALRAIFLQLVSGAIDSAVTVFNRTAWPVTASARDASQFHPF